MGITNEIFNKSRKIVIKIGSNVLSNNEGFIDKDTVRNICEQVTDLTNHGKQVVMVSSGAEVSGVSAIGKWSRHGDVIYKQAMCAIGQVELMLEYKKCFAEHDLIVGQLLLSREDFSDNNRNIHIRNTLFTLLDEKVIPIINENDSVSIEEFSIGDNDMLASLTANLWNADLLVLMSDIDGVFDKSPKVSKDAKLIHEVHDIDELTKNIDSSGKSSFGTGGMITKIEAAKAVSEFNTPMLLVNGKEKNILKRISEGEQAGTIFVTK